MFDIKQFGDWFDRWGPQQKVFGIGDIHGRWQTIRNFWNKYNQETELYIHEKHNVLVLMGDAGLNYFFNYRDQEAKKKMSQIPLTYFVIRGNHEERPSICMEKNPTEWHTEEFWGNTVYVENNYPNIKYALDEAAIYHIPYIIGYCDGTEENDYCDEGMPFWDTYEVLVIPGAYSVDKYHRITNGWSWFENEQLSPQEREKCLRLIEEVRNVDLVLSHTCPIIFEPTDLFLSFIDQSMVDKSMERLLGEVEYRLNYKAWIWGHYHAFRDYPRADGRKKLMLYDNCAIDILEYLEEEEFKKYEL